MLKFILCAVLGLATLQSARAHDEIRKIDFSRVIIGPDEVFKDCKRHDDVGKCLESTELTLGRLCIIAAGQPDPKSSVADQIAHGKLAMRLAGAKELELSIDEIKYLKDQVAKTGFSVIAIYQAERMLDPTVDK